MGWFSDFVESARSTDQLTAQAEHVDLLAAGLLGEAGSILTEVKKRQREGNVYAARTDCMEEEFGDLLWYLARLIDVLAAEEVCHAQELLATACSGEEGLAPYLDLGASAGRLLQVIRDHGSHPPTDLIEPALWSFASAMTQAAAAANIDFQTTAASNTAKRLSRWPAERAFRPFFDGELSVEEQIPRQLELDFLERDRGGTPQVLVRCNNLNLGDRLTDNAWGSDDYRYHDIFHFGNAVYLGWSPVVRALLKCKRKSEPAVDENEDGARARILEEAVSAIVFIRARDQAYFEKTEHLDYDLLKTIHAIVGGYEVANVPLWQWETGILRSYAVFRKLRENAGGRVYIDLEARTMDYDPVRIA